MHGQSLLREIYTCNTLSNSEPHHVTFIHALSKSDDAESYKVIRPDSFSTNPDCHNFICLLKTIAIMITVLFCFR